VPGASGVTKWLLNNNVAPTAESIASYLGWDAEAPIDVDSVAMRR
jgi:hypothetical protein